MITFDYIGGRGVPKNSKNDYVILEQPLSGFLEIHIWFHKLVALVAMFSQLCIKMFLPSSVPVGICSCN